jgi:hypothetical protein
MAYNYKHVIIINDDSSIISKCSFNLIDDPRVITYDRKRFVIQASINKGINIDTTELKNDYRLGGC